MSKVLFIFHVKSVSRVVMSLLTLQHLAHNKAMNSPSSVAVVGCLSPPDYNRYLVIACTGSYVSDEIGYSTIAAIK